MTGQAAVIKNGFPAIVITCCIAPMPREREEGAMDASRQASGSGIITDGNGMILATINTSRLVNVNARCKSVMIGRDISNAMRFRVGNPAP